MGLVPESLAGAVVTNDFPLFNLNAERLQPAFLGWLCRTATSVELCQRASEGTTNRVRLQENRFLELEIPLPPLAEQRRVVARIEELAAQIHTARTLRHQAVEEAEALTQSRLNALTTEVEASDNLGHVLLSKPRNGWSAKCDNADDGIPVLSLGAVTGYRYRSSAIKRTSLHAPKGGHFWLNRGDLLITRSNTPELVGHAAIYDGIPSPCIYPDLMMRLELNPQAADVSFVWYWLQAPPVREFIGRNAKGTSPTMKKISQGIVMAIPFPRSLPLLDQRRIVAELDSLQAEVNALKRLPTETAAELDALLPSILDKAFKGEL